MALFLLAHLSEEELQHLNAKPPAKTPVGPEEAKTGAGPQALDREVVGQDASSSSALPTGRGPQILPEQQVWQEILCSDCNNVIARVKTNPTHPAGPREESKMRQLDGTYPVQSKLASSRLHSTWRGQPRARAELVKWAHTLHKRSEVQHIDRCSQAV